MGNQIKNALVLGAIYALVAIGYTCLRDHRADQLRAWRRLHGPGFYAGVHRQHTAPESAGNKQWRWPAARPGHRVSASSMLAAGLTGMAIQFVAYRRLRDAPRLAPLITAIGVSFLIEGVMLVREGPDYVTTGRGLMDQLVRPSPWERSVSGTPISSVVGTATLLMFALGAFVHARALGKAMRSTAQDRTAALLAASTSTHISGNVLHRLKARRSGRVSTASTTAISSGTSASASASSPSPLQCSVASATLSVQVSAGSSSDLSTSSVVHSSAVSGARRSSSRSSCSSSRSVPSASSVRGVDPCVSVSRRLPTAPYPRGPPRRGPVFLDSRHNGLGFSSHRMAVAVVCRALRRRGWLQRAGRPGLPANGCRNHPHLHPRRGNGRSPALATR